MYVSKDGNDSNPGTLAQPLLTVNRASELAVNPGDRVLVQTGHYPETVITQANGAEGQPILFKAEGDVTLDGFFVVHSHTVIDGFNFLDFPISNFAHITVFEGGDHCLIVNNSIRNSSYEDTHGIEIWPPVQNCVINSNTVHNILGNGVILRGSGHTVANNTLSSLNGYDAFHAFGRDHLIQNNTVKDSPNTKISPPEPAHVMRTWGLYEELSTNIRFTGNVVSNFQGRVGLLEQDKTSTNNISSWTISSNIFSSITAPFTLKIPSSTITNNTFVYVAQTETVAVHVSETRINSTLHATGNESVISSNAFVASGRRFSNSDGGSYAIHPLVEMAATDGNFVAGYPADGYPAKLGFTEPNGINGGDPRFIDINSPLTGGLRPQDTSILCQTGTRPHIGALPCACVITLPVPVIRVQYSDVPGSTAITLDGGDSHACGQSIINYAWDFGDEQSGAGTQVTHVYPSAGTWTVQLTVTNSLSESSTIQQTIVLPHVMGENQPPVVTVSGGTRTVVGAGGTLLLDNVSVVDDYLPNPPGQLTYEWSQDSGPEPVVFENPQSLQTMVQFPATGSYSLILTANDSLLESTGTVHVNVVETPNAPPLVFAGADRWVLIADGATLFDATVSDDGLPDPPGSTTVEWSTITAPGLVEFSNSQTLNPTVTFDTPGIYVLQLEANDGDLISTSTVRLDVRSTPPTNQPPVVFAGESKSILFPNELAFMNDAQVTDDGLPSPPAMTFEWSQVSGPGTAVFSSTNSLITYVEFSSTGLYVIQLTADDGELSASSNVSIQVSLSIDSPIVAYAGPDRIFTIPPGVLALQEAGVTVPGGAFIVEWSQLTGPASAIFTDVNVVNPSVTFPVTGLYTFRLLARQGGATHEDTMNIDVRTGYLLTVVNGFFQDDFGYSNQAYFHEGAIVTIQADHPLYFDNMVFDRWTDGPVTNVGSSITDLIMPGYDFVITALYKEGPSVTGDQPNGFVPFTNVMRNGATHLVIKGNLSRNSHMKLTMHTVSGRDVRTLWDDHRFSGPFQVNWNGRNDSGAEVASGVYVLLLKIDKSLFTSKILVVK